MNLRTERIKQLLTAQLHPEILDVINESHKHHVPEGSETHIKITAVSQEFQSKSRIERHRLIQHLLTDELNQGLHALSMHLFTPDEWEKSKVPSSPACRDGFEN